MYSYSFIEYRNQRYYDVVAKLQPNCPKPERPQRLGTRRESVESGLAAAAAKLANTPVSSLLPELNADVVL